MAVYVGFVGIADNWKLDREGDIPCEACATTRRNGYTQLMF
jgi:hypothetical protein